MSGPSSLGSLFQQGPDPGPPLGTRLEPLEVGITLQSECTLWCTLSQSLDHWGSPTQGGGGGGMDGGGGGGGGGVSHTP